MRGLHRHPREVDLTVEEFAEVAVIVDMMDKAEADWRMALLRVTAGRQVL